MQVGHLGSEMVDVFFQAQLLKKYTHSNLTKVTK